MVAQVGSRIVRNFKRERETFAPFERSGLEIADFRLFTSGRFILRSVLITRILGIYSSNTTLSAWKEVSLVKTLLYTPLPQKNVSSSRWL